MTQFLSALVAATILLGSGIPVFAGPLHDAAAAGNVEQIQELIAAGADIDERAGRRGTPLMFAISKGQHDAAVALIAAGADVDRKTRSGTALHIAALKDDQAMIDALAGAGADIEVASSDGLTPLHFAASVGKVKAAQALVALGANVLAKGFEGQTPLGLAYVDGHDALRDVLEPLYPPPPSVEPVAPRLATADLVAGKRVANACLTCHSLGKDQPHGTAPNLWGVLGRAIASAGGWNYTAALARLPGEWTYEKLNTFLADPATAAPGTVMFYDGLPDPTERANAIAYLRTLSDSPLPLPK